jgi:hypothetical protein
MPADRLRRQLEAARFPLDASTRAAVRQCVFDYVDLMKANGCLPERVIVAVKRVAHDAGLDPSRSVIQRHTPISETDTLLVDMVGWSIQRFYSPGHDS